MLDRESDEHERGFPTKNAALNEKSPDLCLREQSPVSEIVNGHTAVST